MNLYNFDLLPILIALIVVSTVVLWIAIRNYKNFVLMFFLIPLTLYSGWTIYITVDRLLGYPTVDIFEKDTMYISHFENPDISEWIYVWVIKPGEAKPKAIMIPNTKNNQEQLSEAEQKSSNGVQVYMEIDPDGEGQTSGGEINTYDFQQNWGAAEKEKQRQRDQNETRILPGPASNSITPPSTGNRPQLNSDEVNNQQIWRDEESTDYEAIPNPYDFDWADEGSDSFLP